MAGRRITEIMDAVSAGSAKQPPPPAAGSVHGPEDDNIVPGELVVAIEPGALTAMTASIPRAPLRGLAPVNAFGAGELDDLFADLQVQSIAKVHGASPTVVRDGLVMADDFGLDGVFRIRYDGDETPADAAARLSELGEVAWAEPNRFREATDTIPNDPDFATQWGLARINAPAAWDTTTGSPSVTVAVLDTGVDLNHPDLAPLLVAGTDLLDFATTDVPKPGWVYDGDFTGVDNDPQDEVGHGTHVAGTISALSNNAVGVTGVNWTTRLMPVRILARIRETATGRINGSGTSATSAAGIRWAVDNGAQIINMSLGGYGETTVEREAVAYAMDHGVVIVAAMGNDGVTTPSYPAAFPGVVAVAATDMSDTRATWSNTGPHIDISAPGVGIRSTWWDDTYNTISGTSMATPHVAGVAALILARNPNVDGEGVVEILRSTARALRDNPSDPVPNDSYGYGLVQADAAVAAATPIVASRDIACPRSIPRDSCFVPVSIGCPSEITECSASLVSCASVVGGCNSLPLCTPVSLQACPSMVICPTTGVCVPDKTDIIKTIINPAELRARAADAARWSAYDPHGYDPYGNRYR